MGSAPVAIVGGGIGGLATALALLRRDVPCEVYERAPQLREIGSGVALWPGALRACDDLGIGDQVRALSTSWDVGGIRSEDGRFLSRYSGEAFSRVFGERVAGVHRGELQQLLLRELPAGTVQTDHACVGVDLAGDRVLVRFANGTEREARALIGADGQRSVVRTSVFSDRPLHDTGVMAWRGTVTPPPGADWDTPIGETWGRGASFGFLPISHGRLTYFGAEKGDPPTKKAYLAERFGGWHDPIPAVIEATAEQDIWFDRIFELRPMRRWVKGLVALMGDAAHPMTPNLGQGACQAILDARELGTCLGGATDIEAALRAYERRRRLRAGLVTVVAHFAINSARPMPAPVQTVVEAAARAVPGRIALRALHHLTND